MDEVRMFFHSKGGIHRLAVDGMGLYHLTGAGYQSAYFALGPDFVAYFQAGPFEAVGTRVNEISTVEHKPVGHTVPGVVETHHRASDLAARLWDLWWFSIHRHQPLESVDEMRGPALVRRTGVSPFDHQRLTGAQRTQEVDHGVVMRISDELRRHTLSIDQHAFNAAPGTEDQVLKLSFNGPYIDKFMRMRH